MTHPHAHILQAIIDGKEVEYSPSTQEWRRIKDNATAMSHLIHGFTVYKFRIKPTTVTINGVDLEDDRITSEPPIHSAYYTETILCESFFHERMWDGDYHDKHAMKVGIAHRTKEGAIAFCKARLGIKD